MGIKARYVYGSEILDISGAYSLYDRFSLPPVLRDVLYAGDTRISDESLPRDFSYTVRILGASVGETHYWARLLQSFLAKAGDNREDLYFEVWGSDAVPYVPLWGDTWPLRYKVKNAYLEPDDSIPYAVGNVRARALAYSVIQTVDPHATGYRMRLGSATGGIIEDTWGSPDGKSRGLIVPEATTNKMTNPVFGNATWNTGWTAGADIIEVQNTDPSFCLPGLSCSSFLSGIGAANTYTQSINAGNVNKHTFYAIVKRPDGAAVTSADCTVVVNSAEQTPIYTNLGSGWYKLEYANFDGVNAARDFGIRVKTGRAVYLLFSQLEEKVYSTSPCYGDMMGCAWNPTTTPHATKSDRSTSRVMLPTSESIRIGQGSIHIVWKTRFSNTHPNNMTLFDARSAGHIGLSAYFNAADDKFYLHDGVNFANGASQTFAARDVIDLIFTWGTAGLSIYKNGALLNNNATYAPAAFGANMYIGCDHDAGTQNNGTLLGFETYDRALSSIEVANLYADKHEQFTSGDGMGVRVSAIPWQWDKDGDGVLDAYVDATHSDRAVCGGIPGSAPADSIFYIIGDRDHLDYIINNNPHTNYLPSANEFHDSQGTVVAGRVGGEVLTTINVSTSPTRVGGWLTIDDKWSDGYLGKKFYIHFCLADAGSTLMVEPAYKLIQQTVFSEFQALNADATYRSYIVGPLTFPDRMSSFADYIPPTDIDVAIYVKHITGTANVMVDFLRVLTGYTCVVYTDKVLDTQSLVLRGNRVLGFNSNTPVVPSETLIPVGDLIELEPGKYNNLAIISAQLTSTNFSLAETSTLSRIDVIPRFELL